MIAPCWTVAVAKHAFNNLKKWQPTTVFFFADALDKIARGPSAEERHLLLGWNSGGRAVVQSERAMAALGEFRACTSRKLG